MWKWLIGGVVAIVAIGVAVLATVPREIPRGVLEAKYATPPSRFITLADGTRVHYRDRGPRDAPVLVLLHGLGGNLFVWEPWSLALSNRYRVISLDLPGHGLTGAVPSGDYSEAGMAAFVKAFADRLGLHRFALAGLSMGGGVAAHFAELYPGRVTRLILVDALGAYPFDWPRHRVRHFEANVPLLDDLMLDYTELNLPDLAHMQGSEEALLDYYRLPDDSFDWNHARSIRVPTLILWGRKDRTIPVAAAFAWHAAITGSRLVVYPDAPHVSMDYQPRQSEQDVRAFLDSDNTMGLTMARGVN